MRRRKQPERIPHSDPLKEAGLQRIITFQRQVMRREAQLDANMQRIEWMRGRISQNSATSSAIHWRNDVQLLQEENIQLEKELSDLHEDIVRRIAAMDENDAAYLNFIG